jgi:arginyl-tRNA synthetase
MPPVRSPEPLRVPPGALVLVRGTPVIRDQLVDALRATLVALEVEPLPDTINIERPARREHGDWSSNIALAAAKNAGRNPRELAQQIADALNAAPPPHVTAVEIAGPGFVNFRLADSWLHDVLGEVVAGGVDGFARHTFGDGTKVNVEWVSANPTGPLHVGHGRNASYGDSVVRLLERCGYAVTREFYLNDRGTQMQYFAESLRARKKGEQPDPETGYQGQYIIDWAKEMPDDADPLEWGEARSIEDHRQVLSMMHITFDVWTSERSLVDAGKVDEALSDLRARDMAFDAEGAVWLRSTAIGDDKDRVLIKSDGEYTYLLPDIAYHRDKFARGFDLLIDVWGADHHGYVPRMKAAIQALGHAPDDLQIDLTQLVKLQRGGEEVRLSKRTGEIIELRELIDEVGADSARLTFLLQSIETSQTFDIDVVKSQAMDNPVFYVQMAYARIRSIKRRAAEASLERAPLAEVDLSLLTNERELDVLRSLSQLPEVVALATKDRAPHKITTWVRELAGAFHGFYHDCYVMGDDIPAELTQARLWLAEAAEIGLAIGLDLLGVTAPESM